MTNKDKIEEMAKEIYMNAIMGAQNLGTLSSSTRSKMLEGVKEIGERMKIKNEQSE